MESKLVFQLELATGETVSQEITVPADKVELAINQQISGLMQLGYLQRLGNKLIIQRVIRVEVEIPTIHIASPDEMPKGGIIQP